MDENLSPARRQAADWLILLREEPEDALLQARFEAWLDTDPDHVRAWVSITEIFETLGEVQPAFEMQRASPSAVATSSPSRRRRGMLRNGRRIGERIRPGVRGVAVAVAAVAACAALVLAPAIGLRLQADYLTGAGELKMLRLADGSQVRLGPQSAIAVDYSGDARTVRLLAGQAWFEVRRDPAHPFRVEAGDVRTTVLGTGFDVRRIGDVTNVAVRHGRVRVVDHGVAPVTSRELTAGQWVRIAADHEVESGAQSPGSIGGWREGGLVMRNRRIADVIDELRPWYGGRILLTDTALGQRRIDGVYDPRDPASALTALVDPHGGHVRRITPWLIVVSGS